MKDIKCPKCESQNNLILFVNFKDKKAYKAVCFKRKIKPHLVRKFNKVILNGCGHNFNLTTRKFNGEDNRHIHEKLTKAGLQKLSR